MSLIPIMWPGDDGDPWAHFAILRLRFGPDVNDVFNLLGNSKSGFILEDWTPATPGYKDGGTYQSSPIAEGRRLVDQVYDSVFEAFRFKAKSGTADGLILLTQELRRILIQAEDYWVLTAKRVYTTYPVYLEVRAKGETFTRYGLIKSGRLPVDDNPFDQPFLQIRGTVFRELDLILEHEPFVEWVDNLPIATATGADNEGGYLAAAGYSNVLGGLGLSGNVDAARALETVTTQDAYFAPVFKAEHGLTHVFVDDGGAVGANLLGAALPITLLPAVPVIGDAVYFGVESGGVPRDAPFNSIIFPELTTPGVGYSGVWEAWTGAAWVALTVGGVNREMLDSSAGMTQGPNAQFSWFETSFKVDTGGAGFWTVVAFNGVTAWWLRFRVTAVPGPLTAPVVSRYPYTVSWNFVEIDAADDLAPFDGDLPAFAALIHQNRSSGFGGEPQVATDRILIGARDEARNAGSFQSIINLWDVNQDAGDDCNFTNISFARTVGATFSIVSDPEDAAVGQKIRWTPATTTLINDLTLGTVTIGTPAGTPSEAEDYRGLFRVFVVMELSAGFTGGPEVTGFRVEAEIGDTNSNVVQISRTVHPGQAGFDPTPFDFGYFQIPPADLDPMDPLSEVRITIKGDCPSLAATGTVDLYALWLVPVDEGVWDFTDIKVSSWTSNHLITFRNHHISGISYPRNRLYNAIRADGAFGDTNVLFTWQAIGGQPFTIRPRQVTRFYCFPMKDDATPPLPNKTTNIAQLHRGKLRRNARYLSMRGDR
jgi:hypothetical protein